MFNNKKILVAAFVVLAVFFTTRSYGDDLLAKFHPFVSVVEEYNDNIYRTYTNKQDDWITTISPGISFSNMDAQAGVDLRYVAGFVKYAHNNDRDYISHNAGLNAKYLTRSHWNFYLTDTFVRSNEPDEPSQLELIYSPAVQTSRYNYWRNILSPKVEYQYGRENKAGLTYRNTKYSNDDPTTEKDSREHYVNPFWTHWLNQRNGFEAQYGYSKGTFDNDPDMTGHMGSLRYLHRTSAKSVAYIEYKYLTRSFDDTTATRKDYKIHDPKVGFTYTLTPTLTLSGQAGYYRMIQDGGDTMDGPSYDFSLTQKEQKTTYSILLQGGQSEDYFSSANYGFVRYNRLVISVQHKVTPKLSLGASGNFTRSDIEDPADIITVGRRRDNVFGVSVSGSYMLTKWLSASLNLSRQERRSAVDYYDYTEYKGVASLTATY